MILHNIIQFIFLAIGAVTLYAAIADSDWIFKSHNAGIVVKYCGRGKARIIYGFFGVLLMVMAVIMYFYIF